MVRANPTYFYHNVVRHQSAIAHKCAFSKICKMTLEKTIVLWFSIREQKYVRGRGLSFPSPPSFNMFCSIQGEAFINERLVE